MKNQDPSDAKTKLLCELSPRPCPSPSTSNAKPASYISTGTLESSPFEGLASYMHLQVGVCDRFRTSASKNWFT